MTKLLANKIIKFTLIGCLFLFCCCATVKFYGEKELKNKDIFLSLMRGVLDSEYDKKNKI